MAPDSTDPTVLRSLAVTAEDVVAAVETNRTTDREAVLRVTPPFSGRMRARLHLRHDRTDAPAPLYIDPELLLDPDAPSYPRPADTEDELRADTGREYTVERHREYHADAVDSWRSDLRDSIGDRATVETPRGRIAVDVTVLG